jgi:dipeptidyl aminopeptidase/acylaminoacyl peptidase
MLLGNAALARYPLFIAQGTDDKIWDAEMARRLVERLTLAGRAPEAHFFDGEGQVFQASARNREWALLIEFFERHLAIRVRDTRDCSGPNVGIASDLPVDTRAFGLNH